MRIDNEVLNVLGRAETHGTHLLLVGQLDRNLYERTNKVLEAAGGKWNRRAKAHIFDAVAADRIDQILLTGEVVIPKDEFEFFESPPAVVNRLLDKAQIVVGAKVLEPNAGKGAIALACAMAGGHVDCYELMDANYKFLANHPGISWVRQADFLAVEPNPIYDRVVMNPPFSKQADIKHVNHALKFLKPGGRLVSVMSAGVTFRDNKLTQDFRDMVEDRGDIEALPEGSFKESGTSVNTVIVTIDN